MNGVALTQEQWLIAFVTWAIQLASPVVALLVAARQMREARKERERYRLRLELELWRVDERIKHLEEARYHGTGVRVKTTQYGKGL